MKHLTESELLKLSTDDYIAYVEWERKQRRARSKCITALTGLEFYEQENKLRIQVR